MQDCSTVHVFRSKSGVFWNGVLKTLLALKVISVRSKNNLTDVAECENNITFWVCIAEVGAWWNTSESDAAKHSRSCHCTEIPGKSTIRFSMWWVFPRFTSWLIHGHRQNRCGIAPWRENLCQAIRKTPDGWTGEPWSWIQLDTQPVCVHHLQGWAWRSVQAMWGVSDGIWLFCGSHRLVLAVAGASSSTPPDTAPPPARGEDRGRGNHSGVTRGLAN